MTTQRYTTTKPARKRGFTLAGLWLVIALTVGGFAAAAITAANRPLDASILCQQSALQAVATTAVIVDATDSFTDYQRRRLKTTVDAERDRLPIGGRLIVLGLNPEKPWEPIEFASVCNPGKAEDANAFFVTKSKIAKRWQTQVADPIDRAIAQSIERPYSERSPIIITIAATLARADFDNRVASRRLILVSDLLEHDKAGYSQLRGGDFWSQYQASTLPRTARLDLQGVSIAVDYLQRGTFAGIQGPRHQTFWQRLLTEAGASDLRFLGISMAAQVTPSAMAEPTPKPTIKSDGRR